MPENSVYAAPQTVTGLDGCGFYHTMDIPGYGQVVGEWDLREGLCEYLGGVDLRGKRVLDVGTASGFLCFAMEAQGADVVACDLSPNESWDIVPFAGDPDYDEFSAFQRSIVQEINNAFWLCHRAYNSNAKMIHSSVYAIPQEIGLVDVSVFGSILLHVRDPFLALQNALRLTRETAIVAELAGKHALFRRLLRLGRDPHMVFLPEAAKREPKATWWSLSPQIIQQFMAVLGFEDTTVSRHTQKRLGNDVALYTVVGRRTRGQPVDP